MSETVEGLPEGWEWQQPPRKVPESEFNRARRKALARKRGIHGKDPLAGKRREIMAGATRLRWPHSEPCPVEPGDVFTVGRVPIAIKRVIDRLKDGQHVWEVTIERLPVPDKPRHLRAGTLPSDPPERDELDDRGQVPPPRPGEIERAAEESAYTTSIARALDREAEAVPRDWEDRGKESREVARLEAVKEGRELELVEQRTRNLTAKVKMGGSNLIRHGRSPLPYLDRMLEIWAEYEAEVDRVELDEAA